jgi:ankyrin repeat protein
MATPKPDDFLNAYRSGDCKKLYESYHHHPTMSPYFFAAYYNNVDACDLLLYNGDHSYDVPDFEGDTPLMIACNYKNIESVKWFIDIGCNIHHVNNRGYTPLSFTLQNRFHDGKTVTIIKMLLSANRHGVDMVYQGSNKSSTNVLQMLLATPYIFNDDLVLELVNLFTSYTRIGDVFNALNIHSPPPITTYLRTVIGLNHELVDLLLKYSNNMQRIDTYGYLPISYAAKHCDTYALSKLILRNRESIVYQDANGDTPLHIAVEKYSIPAIKLLLEFSVIFGVDLHKKNYQGVTPIQQALNNFEKPFYHNLCIPIIKLVHSVIYRVDDHVFSQILTIYDLQCIVPTEEEILNTRYEVYFKRSFVSGLLMFL